MKSHQLKVKSSPDRKRIGRGIGSGTGKTSGRGTKGQNSRTGGGVRPGFEGGQNPLAKRLPKKRGFASLNRVETQVINLSQLANLAAGSYDIAKLKEAGLVNYLDRPVKILGDGEVKKKLVLQVQRASASARSKIEQAGGTIEFVELPRKRTKVTEE
jgi:large subunit ribosomal protein L15